MNNKIKIIIADDNYAICDTLEMYLNKFEDIEILGKANNDADEILMIENLKPDIVISDLERDGKYTGLEIIKQFNKKKGSPKFLVFSADKQEDFIHEEVVFDGYIQKPCWDLDEIIRKIRNISPKNLIFQ